MCQCEASCTCTSTTQRTVKSLRCPGWCSAAKRVRLREQLGWALPELVDLLTAAESQPSTSWLQQHTAPAPNTVACIIQCLCSSLVWAVYLKDTTHETTTKNWK
jgi:hypothetical protein